MLSKARDLMQQLRDQGLQPSDVAHSAMVDALARSGQLPEAEQYLLANIPRYMPAHVALLSACCFQNEVQRAERTFDRALKLPTKISSETKVQHAAMHSMMADMQKRLGRAQ